MVATTVNKNSRCLLRRLDMTVQFQICGLGWRAIREKAVENNLSKANMKIYNRICEISLNPSRLVKWVTKRKMAVDLTMTSAVRLFAGAGVHSHRRWRRDAAPDCI